MSEVDAGPGPSGQVVYREYPRGYRETLIVSLVFLIGFAIDLAFDVGGAVTHLPGWLIAAAVVIGFDAILVAAARSTHTLTVTSGEVWVGEEMISRDGIAGASPADLAQLPVLGWPTGKSGRLEGVALRLADGRDVLIPSRHPSRLSGVLGVGEAPRVALDVRRATDDDLPQLADIDARAEIIFRVAGYDLPRIEFDTAGLADAAVVFVAGDPPVGFAVVDLVDGQSHLAELSVLPSSMRRGIGTRLVTAVCDWARAHDHGGVTLITYADISWNGPFYRRFGFAEVPFDELTPELRSRRERQTRLGLDVVGRRIVMRRDLTA